MHLKLCYNEATDLQYEILAKQMPSMNQRIQAKNTRELYQCYFTRSENQFCIRELAEQGFTPSVFSLDLPTKGNSEEEKEALKEI
jgi:isopentenyl diphosphate isomerase/L-lactate dehydrogenase-like FMN-dependent dehydrogenase